MIEATDGYACTTCGRHLRLPLLRQLVDLNPHEPYPPKVQPSSGLVAFWITRPGAGFSLGVTARSLGDAVEIAVRAGYELPESFRVADNIRLEDLDPRHVAPNAGPLIVRGVWYPLTNLGAGA
jgi:hypothetical protein